MITRAMNEYPETPNIILQNRRGEKLGVIENATNLVHTVNMNSADEISFKVYKEVEGNVCRLWNDIHDFRLVYIPDYHESFEIEVSLSESTDTVKSVTGTQFQYAELSQVNLYDVQINTEDDIARDDYDEKYPTTFYRDDKDHKDASLLDRILKDKASHYEIYHVDNSLKNITRTFNFSGKDIISALNEIAEEADCLFVFGETDTPFDGKLHRTISAYDLEDYCQDCGERGMFKDKCTKCGSTNYILGYGKDTGVFISKDNIAETVNYETNSGEVKNCFKLKAGDDLMTATVRNCNPNGSDYIWYFTDQTKADMSDALSNALTQYDKDYEEIYSNKQMDISQSAVDDYNSIVEKYKDYSKNNGEQHEPISYPIKGYGAMISADYNAMDLYSYLQNTMMPGSSTVQETTAEKEAAKLTSATLSPIGVENTSVLTRVTQDNAVMSYAKVLYDFSKYSITVKSSRMVTTESWGGILTLKSYTDSKDVADTGYIAVTFNNDALTFTKQKIDKAMKSKEAYAISAPEVIKLDYDDFVSHVHNRYGLNPLKVFESCLQSAVDVLTEQGCGQDYGDDRNFHSIYEEYVKKLNYIKTEEGERQSEMDQIAQYEDSKLVGGLLAEIENQRLSVRQSLDMKTYLDKIDNGLWAELNSFRREQEYSNSNYISTNLTNSETVKNAQDFLKKATLELIKSATLQHSISGSLYDLLIMPEFDGLLDNFDVGNWIRLMVDGEVYKLRLKSYTVDYDAANIQRINATFSDVINGLGTVDDLKSIFDSAKSVATSYNAVMRQADKGNKANTQIENFVNEGLNLTNSKIVSDDNQNVTYDEHGILLRRKDDLTDAYEPTQLKIINNGMYYTRNNWTTAESAFGKFLYVDPSDNFAEKTGYGVIANHLVGNLILGKQVGIYNQAGSVTINESGINLSADSNSNNQNLLKINRRNDDGTVNNIVSLNKKGKLVIDGSVLVKSSSSGDTQTIDALADRVKDVSVEYAQNQSQTEAPDDGWQTTAIKQKEGYYIWLRVKTVSGDDTVTYSVPTCVTAINGQSITVTSVTFAQGDNGTTAPTQGWQTSVPTVAQGKWLWCRTTFSDGMNADTCSYVGTDGKDGTSVAIESVTKVDKTTTVVLTDANGKTKTLSINDGVDGDNGNGVHIAWSNSADGKTDFTTNNKKTGADYQYIGVYTDDKDEDSTNYADYTWTKIKGEDGTSVTIKNIQYASGTSGTTAPTTGWQNTVPSVSAGQWLWCKTTYSNGSESTTCSYMGTDGQDGKSVAVESVTKSDKVTTVKLKDSDGNETSFQIKDGEDGSNGIGINGTNAYVHIAWSNSADGSTDFSTTASSGKKYMGVYTDSTQADSGTYSDYSWTLIKGADGTSVTVKSIAFAQGTSGTTAPADGWQTTVPSVPQGQWLWCRTTYSDNSTADTCSYIGTDGNDGNSVYVESVTKSDKTTTVKLKNTDGTESTLAINDGKDGTNGAKGANGYVHIAWANSEDGKTDFSTSVSDGKQYIGVYTDNTENDSNIYTDYSWTKIKGDDGTTIVSISYAQGDNGTTAPSSGWQSTVPTISQGKWLWCRTTYSDGNTADTCSYTGTDGDDGTSVVIDSVTKTDKTTTVKLSYSNGKTETLSINDGSDGDNGKGIHIAWANSSDGKTDFVTNNKKTGTNYQYIGVYTDDKTDDSTKYTDYTWTKVKGSDGTSVTVTSVEYASGDNGTTAPTTGWQTTVPSVAAGKWLWCKTTYSDSNVSYTCSYMGTDGVDGKSVAVESVVKSGKTTTVKLKDSDGNETSFQINDGQDGTNGIGINGTNAYVHLAWANSADGKTDFSTTVSSGKSYMGVYTDSTEGDSTTYSDYTWTKIKGADGTSVTVKSIQYASGDSGTTAPTTGWQNTVPSVTQGKWLWCRTTYSNGSTADTCSYMGTDGDDGNSVAVESVTKSGKVTTVKLKDTAGKETSFQITDGTDGKDGIGIAGTNSYIHIAWSNSSDGKTDFSTTASSGKSYMGVYTDDKQADSSTYSDYSWTKIKGDTGAKGADGQNAIDLSNGKMLFTDPYFASGLNSVHVYNNSNNGNVTITRIARTSDNPFTNSNYQLQIQNVGTSSPSCGGFKFVNQSRANAIFVYRIIAKIPTGRNLCWATNPIGSGSVGKWLTPVAGTGTFTEYLYYLKCGATGSFNIIGYFYIDGDVGSSSSPVTWYVAYATCFDMTNVSDAQQAYDLAVSKSKTIYSTTDPTSTTGYRSGDTWFNQSTGGIWQYNGTAWQLHKVGTVSIADGAITADKIVAGAVTADKIAAGSITAEKLSASSVSLGNLDSSLITSNLLPDSVNNIDCWLPNPGVSGDGTMNDFLMEHTGDFEWYYDCDDHESSINFFGVGDDWEWIYYKISGLNRNESVYAHTRTYTLSFEFKAMGADITLLSSKTYIPFGVFGYRIYDQQDIHSVSKDWNTGNLATIQISPSKGGKRYSVTFSTYYNTIYLAFNFGYIADQNDCYFSFGKFKLEVGSEATPWETPKGLYLDKDEMHINADAITSGTVNAVDILGSHISGGTIVGNTIKGGSINGTTITGTTINGNTITGGTISGTTITGTTISGNTISGGSISGTSITGGTVSGSTIVSGNNNVQIRNGRVILQTDTGNNGGIYDYYGRRLLSYTGGQNLTYCEVGRDCSYVYVANTLAVGVRSGNSPCLMIGGGGEYAWLDYRVNENGGYVMKNNFVLYADKTLTRYNISVTSDQRLKHDIVQIPDSVVDKICDTKLVQFALNDDPENKPRYGVIAQDVLKCLPSNQSIVSKADDGHYTVDYTQFLIARLAYDEKRIDSLTKQIEKLGGNKK